MSNNFLWNPDVKEKREKKTGQKRVGENRGVRK